MKRYIIPIALLALLPLTAWTLRPAAAAPALKEGTPKWEYQAVFRYEIIKSGKKISEEDRDDKQLTVGLNALGGEGWQLVEIDTGAGRNLGAQPMIFIFRRPK